MQVTHLIELVGLGLFLYCAVVLIHSLFSQVLSIPGPFLARFTDAWYLFKIWQGKFERVNLALHKKYGPIVRYGPNRYSINDLEATTVIYGIGNVFSKSSWYSAWESTPGRWNLFSDRSITRHGLNRKLYSSPFSMSSMIQYEPFLDECGNTFASRLLEFSKAGTSLDLGYWFQCYAFDTIAYATYGQRLGFLDNGQDIDNIMESFDRGLVYGSLIGVFPSIHRHVMPVLRSLFPSLRPVGLMAIVKFTGKQIAGTRNLFHTSNGSSDRTTFLSQFLKKNTQDSSQFTELHIFTGCAANMVAGSDTTAISLSAIMYYLLKSPDCMRKLQNEIDQFYHRGQLSRNPSLNQSRQLPYLQAVIKEALRMHPATGLPLERVVPKGGCTIAGRFFPEGSIVGTNCWVHHQNKHIFGQDADIFRPERWLVNNKERLSLMNRNWIPFGMGSRACLGRNFSIMEINKVIPRILHEFRFQLLGPSTVDGVSWITRNAWFVKPQGFYVRVERRRDGN